MQPVQCQWSTASSLFEIAEKLGEAPGDPPNIAVDVRQFFCAPDLYITASVPIKESRFVALAVLAKKPALLNHSTTPQSIQQNQEMQKTAYVARLLWSNERLLHEDPEIFHELIEGLKEGDAQVQDLDEALVQELVRHCHHDYVEGLSPKSRWWAVQRMSPFLCGKEEEKKELPEANISVDEEALGELLKELIVQPRRHRK